MPCLACTDIYKKDACDITAFLPPGDQTVKYKFSPGAIDQCLEQNIETKNWKNIAKRKYKNISGVKSRSVGDGKEDILFMVPKQISAYMPFYYKSASYLTDYIHDQPKIT